MICWEPLMREDGEAYKFTFPFVTLFSIFSPYLKVNVDSLYKRMKKSPRF